jgi:FAD/FMN-containing dehydrogenase
MGKRDELATIVGKERVLTDQAILEGFQSDSSLVSGEAPECVVQPRRLEDVQSLVRLANEKGWPLLPCSSSDGPRFGGDTVPKVAGTVIVDLSQMNSILRVDKRNKVAMVQPGVTFAELIHEVAKEGLRVEMPMMPKKEKSVLASLLEREPTTAPKYNWDACDPMCCVELILGNGDMFRTGNAAGPGTLEEQWAAGQAQKVGMGPAQTDMGRIIQGAQGTMGIATWATIKLELKPQILRGFMVAADRPDGLVDFTYKLLWRKLPDVCLLLNNVDLAAIYGADPTGLPPWVLVYSISGLEHLPEERLNYLEEDIAEIAEAFQVEPMQYVAGLSADRLVDVITKPSGDTYWKLDPTGACQDLFFLTTLERSPDFVKLMEAEAEAQGFSKDHLGTYIQPIRHGTGCHLEFNLMYDPTRPEKIEQVRALLDSAAQKCMDKGAFFSRPYGSLAGRVYSKCPDTVSALRKVKDILDPQGIMNPGKLCFS